MGTENTHPIASLYQRLGVIHINRQAGFVVRGMKLSPFYVDGMRISTTPEGLRLVIDQFSERLEKLNFDVIAAPSLSGVPYASVISHKYNKRLLIDRGMPSKHGMKRRLEGELRAGDQVVIVDDIAKRGQTLLDVGAEVMSMGASILCAMVVVDGTTSRERGMLEAASIQLVALTTLADLGVSPDLNLDNSVQP
jgi:orotate phosphoribosyltransferase